MGKRRRLEEDYGVILRKVKKLEAKLKKRRRRSSRSSSSESDYEYERRRYYEGEEIVNGEEEVDNTESHFDYYDVEGALPSRLESTVQSAPPLPPSSAAPARFAPVEPSAPTALPTTIVPLTTDETPHSIEDVPSKPDEIPHAGEDVPSQLDEIPLVNEDVPSKPDEIPRTNEDVPSLDPDILQLLGDDPTTVHKYGVDFHKDIASRWAYILCNGLTKEVQLDIIKKYLPPQNCPNIAAPKLNPEIKAALSDLNIKQDLYSQNKQNQLSSGLIALGQVLTWALSPNNNVPQTIIKTLGDAGRLFCDTHYKESFSRRYATLNSLNKGIRDTIKDTKINEQLFGTDLSDHIKSSKAISKTGSDLRQPPYRPVFRPPSTQLQRGALNSRGAPLPQVRAATEQRSTPAPRRPPPPRQASSSRGRDGRRYNNYSRNHQHTKRR